MAIPSVAFKRQNHRLLLCQEARKGELLSLLLAEHDGKKITVVTAGDTAAINVPDTVTVLGDDALEGAESCDLLISYDLPEVPQRYLERMALAREGALALLGEEDRSRLMGIEMLLGRAISQERPEGFAPEESAAPTQRPKRYKKPSARLYEEDAPKKAPAKPKGKGAPRKPKESGVSRYIGTDENGKPMFSGKTGERNHRADGKPHTEESLAAKKEWEEKRKKSGGKKPYDAKKKPPYKGDKKPYDAKKSTDKPADKKAESTKPKRPMIRIKAEKLKKSEPKK
ncbi:hypothetical protein WCX49_09525 [Sulfurimonas sp. HSL-1656]|uniref:hypothetical protein n=1 Tax=Thiomicrolovo subterrani TaxID=3131934 RepID=UPI0031F81C4E